jgi:hypothetical protein
MARTPRSDPLQAQRAETVQDVFSRIQSELRDYVTNLGIRDFSCYNPLTAMAKMAVNPATPPDLRLRCHAEIAGYLYPKLKSMDIGLPPGTEAKLTIEITSYSLDNSSSSRTNSSAIDVTPVQLESSTPRKLQ